MAKKTPSKVNAAYMALKGFLGGSLISIFAVGFTDVTGSLSGLVLLFGFFGIPILAGINETFYPARKFKQWSRLLSGGTPDRGQTQGRNIEFSGTWNDTPIRWTLPKTLTLGPNSDGSIVSLDYGDGESWPQNVVIQASDRLDLHGYRLYVDGPEDYVAACITPELRRTLDDLCTRYSLWVSGGRLHFDIRCTQRTKNRAELAGERNQFLELAQHLSVPPAEMPTRLWNRYQSILMELDAGIGAGVEYDALRAMADHVLSVLIRHHGHTPFTQEKIQEVMDSDCPRSRLIAVTEVLMRSARRERMPAVHVDQAVAFMESVLQEDTRHDGPFGPALRGFLGHLGRTRGQRHLTECLQMVDRFRDEVGVISALFETCAEWSQWPEPALIQKILTGDLLVGTGGQDIVKSLKIYFEQTPDQAVFDQIAMTCIDSMPPLSVPRSLESFEAHLELLTWVGSAGSLALVGPLATLAESLPRFSLTLAAEDSSFLSRLALEAKRSRSALVERHGDGGGRLSILNEATHAEGGVSLAQDAESSTESS